MNCWLELLLSCSVSACLRFATMPICLASIHFFNGLHEGDRWTCLKRVWKRKESTRTLTIVGTSPYLTGLTWQKEFRYYVLHVCCLARSQVFTLATDFISERDENAWKLLEMEVVYVYVNYRNHQPTSHCPYVTERISTEHATCMLFKHISSVHFCNAIREWNPLECWKTV